MGRELRRKQAKKEGKSLEKDEIIEEHQMKRFLIIIGMLLVILVLIYLLSAVFVTKEANWFNNESTNTSNTESTSVAGSILASAVFNQSEETYYVYFYDFKDEENSITEIVNNKLSEEKVYKVDTSSALNANYVADTGNKKAKNISELKVVTPTLIKISKNKIVEYYEKNEITTKLS